MDPSASVGNPSIQKQFYSISEIAGKPQNQDPTPSVDDLQSLTLSNKQMRLFSKSENSANISCYTYLVTDMKGILVTDMKGNLIINRFAIKKFSLSLANNQVFQRQDLILIEKEIFELAFKFLADKISADEAIKARRLSWASNVVLVDIFATEVDKISNVYKIKEDKQKGIAETHTICLWKKTKAQFMIIDPSSSEFSDRLKISLSKILSQKGETCDIIEHTKAKFYTVPEGTIFSQKSVGPEKSRDCIDIAFKIAYILNEGILLYDFTFQMQQSINLLSNQSAVNPILGTTNNGTLIKHLQSTSFSKRTKVIRIFSSIPNVFKQFFDYNAWLKFMALEEKQQNSILKTLTVFINEIESSKLLEKKLPAEIQFERLEKLSVHVDPLTKLRKDLQDDGEINLKLKANSFTTTKK